MVRGLKWMVSAVVAMGVMAWTGGANAADDATKGTIAGTVVDKDGKAVEGADVRVNKPRPPRGEGAPRPTAQAEGDAKPAPGAEGPGGGRQRPPAIAEGKTDKDGKFSLSVPAGEYSVSAMVQGKGRGMSRVTVKAGETATVALKLEERQPGQRRPGAGAGNAN